MLCSGRATAKTRLIFGQAGLGRAAWAIVNMPAGCLYFCLSVSFPLNVSITVTVLWSGENFFKCLAVCTPTVFSDALSFSVYILEGFHMYFISASLQRMQSWGFHYAVSKWLFKYSFYEEGVWKVWGKQEWIVTCPDVLNVEKIWEFHIVSVACLLPFIPGILWVSLVLPLSHSELVAGFFLLWTSSFPNCEVVNKGMSKGEVKKEVNAWKKHKDKQ